MDEDIDYDDPEDAFVESNPAPRPAPRRTRRPERPAPAATGGTSGRVVRPPTGQSSSGNPRAPRPPAKTPVVVPPVAGPPRRARTDSTGRPEREGRRERPTRPERPARPEQAEARRPRRERPTPPPPPVEEYEDYEDDEYADEDDGFDSGFPEPARTQRPAPPVEEYEDYEDDEYADEDDDEYEDDEPAALEVFDKPSRKARPAPEPDPVPNRPRKRQMRYSDTPVVVACAFKGGVGKTTMAMGLAQRAAEHGGKRVIVVDANRGQSDITTYLRLGRAKLPTIWDAARTGDPRKGFAQPSEINKARHAKLEQIPFGLVLGPPATKADPRIVTAEVYRDVIETARRAADLVILDTQIIEAHDTSGLIDGLVIPILQGGGWAVAISDLSSASVKNAHTGTERFKSAGVPVDRLLMLLNRVDASANVDLHELGNSFRDRASLIGSITADAETVQAMNQGQIVSDAPDMAELFDEILFRITADEVFDPAQHTGFMEAGRGFLGRLFGRNR